mgnify:CR=1 FL=1
MVPAGSGKVPGGFRVGSGWVPGSSGGFRLGSGWVPGDSGWFR